MEKSLFNRSIEIILENQTSCGAYIASPVFTNYRYCWIRDGSYIAYAMDLVGQNDSAGAFHNWVAKIILERKELFKTEDTRQMLKTIGEKYYLHTRFNLDGKEAKEDWPNFQLDGYGTWLWALTRHFVLSGRKPDADLLESARFIAKYLIDLWNTPCYDLWEENPDDIHPYTLACIYGGLNSISSFLDQDFKREAQMIRDYVLDHYERNNSLYKFPDGDMVDASLVGVSVPYDLFSPQCAVMKGTIGEIEKQLMKNGGVHRYREDSYYGGGEWILLSAWMGWYYLQIGERNKARNMLHWVESQADTELNLPEQISCSLNVPSKLDEWKRQWGDIAKPLLWSHAMYIILFYEYEKDE